MDKYNNFFDQGILLFKDEHIIVINKPPNLLSIPDGYEPDLPHLRQVLEPQFGALWIVHRLDKETSGAMILARNAQSHRQLNADFRERSIKKTYHGLVTPLPSWMEKDIQLPLKPNADRKHRSRVDQSHGKPAHTICKVLKRFPCGALMEMQISTGIIHQIRAHLREFEIVLLGEKLYNAGLPPQPIAVDRLMLHSRSLVFDHPMTGERLAITAPYPNDFRDAYTKLRLTTNPDELI
jgi:RluA family pseudouridine synthase